MPEPVIKIFIGFEEDGEEVIRGSFDANDIKGMGGAYTDAYIAQVFRHVCEQLIEAAEQEDGE